MVKRQPLVVVLLSVPFRLAVWIRQHTGKVVGWASETIIQVILTLLNIFNFRTGFIQLAISGIFRVLILSSVVAGAAYYYILGLKRLWYEEHPILSSLIVIAELILAAYVIKKGWGMVLPNTKQKIKLVNKQAFKDFASLILTILTVCTLVGIVNLKNCPRDADQYYKFIINAFSLGIINIIELPFIILLIPFPWRLYMFFSESQKLGRSDRIVLAILYFIYGITDLPYAVILVFLLVTVVKTKTMLRYIRNGELRRAIILHQFFSLIFFVIKVVLGIIIACGVVRAKALYKSIFKTDRSHLFEDMLWHLLDTLLFVPGCVLFMLVLIPVYRLKYIHFNFKRIMENSADYEQFLYELLFQIPEEISDFLHLLLLTVSVVFFWRFIPFIIKFRFRGNWHKEVIELFMGGLTDLYRLLPTILLCTFILVTVYRIPLAIRRKRMHAGLFSLTLDVTKEILKDFLTLPYFLVKLVCPWRLIPIMIQIWKTNIPKEQRKIMKQDGLRPLEDYLTFVFVIILILSVWRTAEIISLVVSHIRQVINHDKVTSSLFRKVFRKFCQLLIDALMLVMMILIFVMMIEVPNFFRRMRSFYLLYKERRGIQLFIYISSLFPAKPVIKEKKKEHINKMNKNVFTNVCSFLDIKTLGNVAQANKKFKELVSFPPVWKEQYEKYWKSHIPASSVREIAWDDDYKKLAIEGYTNFIEKNKDVILDEQERDYRMGARAIVLEEFVLSIFGFPHIIALPAKAVVYILSKIDYDKYFQSPRYSRLFSFEIWASPSENVTMFYNTCKSGAKPDEDTLKSFYHIQLNCLYIIMCIVFIIVEQVTFFVCAIDLFLLRIFSFGTAIPLNAVVVQRNVQQLWTIQYLLQLVVALIIVAMKLAMLVLPWMASYKYTNYTMFGCAFGPAYVNILAYLVLYANLMTVYKYFGHFPQFRPHMAGYFIITFLNKGIDVGVVLLNALIAIVKGVWRMISEFFRGLKLFLPKGQIFSLYKAILISSGGTLKNWGYLGDLIYTPLVLAWIFWPLAIPYIFENWYLFLPVFPVVIFLLIKGYGIAKNSWDDKEN